MYRRGKLHCSGERFLMDQRWRRVRGRRRAKWCSASTLPLSQPSGLSNCPSSTRPKQSCPCSLQNLTTPPHHSSPPFPPLAQDTSAHPLQTLFHYLYTTPTQTTIISIQPNQLSTSTVHSLIIPCYTPPPTCLQSRTFQSQFPSLYSQTLGNSSS